MTQSIRVKRNTESSVFDNFRDIHTKLDTHDYHVLEARRFGDYIIAWVDYTSSQDYNSQKILLWKGMTAHEFKQLQQMELDFDPSTKLLGIFKPTVDAFNLLIDMVRMVQYGRIAPTMKPELYLK